MHDYSCNACSRLGHGTVVCFCFLLFREALRGASDETSTSWFESRRARWLGGACVVVVAIAAAIVVVVDHCVRRTQTVGARKLVVHAGLSRRATLEAFVVWEGNAGQLLEGDEHLLDVARCLGRALQHLGDERCEKGKPLCSSCLTFVRNLGNSQKTHSATSSFSTTRSHGGRSVLLPRKIMGTSCLGASSCNVCPHSTAHLPESRCVSL